jgi:hypothetical protein
MSPEYKNNARIFVKNKINDNHISAQGWDFRVALNEEFTLFGSPKHGASLVIIVGGAKVKINTNCRQPLGWGDKFGPIQITGLTPFNGQACHADLSGYVPNARSTDRGTYLSRAAAYLQNFDDDDAADDDDFNVDDNLSETSSNSGSSSRSTSENGTLVALSVIITLIVVFAGLLVVKMRARSAAAAEDTLIIR